MFLTNGDSSLVPWPVRLCWGHIYHTLEQQKTSHRSSWDGELSRDLQSAANRRLYSGHISARAPSHEQIRIKNEHADGIHSLPPKNNHTNSLKATTTPPTTPQPPPPPTPTSNKGYDNATNNTPTNTYTDLETHPSSFPAHGHNVTPAPLPPLVLSFHLVPPSDRVQEVRRGLGEQERMGNTPGDGNAASSPSLPLPPNRQPQLFPLPT